MGTVDQTMPALFAQAPRVSDREITPLAQLGAGSDGTSLLARRGDRLVEIHQLAFGHDSPRWTQLEARVREISAIDHPSVRPVLGLSPVDRELVVEGDSFPPLAELIEQGSVDLARAVRILLELGRAIGAAHHLGIFHARLTPWSVQVGANDRPRFELTQVETRHMNHLWASVCVPPDESGDATSDVYAIGALLGLFATNASRTPNDELASIISDATASDPDARPALVELIRRMQAALGGPGRATLQDIETPVRPPRPAVGVTIGRFELVQQLGVGAMGEVWQARDQAGGPDVAIKLLKPDIASNDDLLRRFRKEARTLAKVGSPYIANIVDLNEDRGLHYLVLELVTGGSVTAAVTRAGKLTERLALAIVADACRALVEPHRLGIVHRDVKPDNMMLVREGCELDEAPSGQLVKLGDFGIARVVEEAHGHDTGTREGQVLGTPEYMAPEQCQGAMVTPATDVYALGCCVFSLIAGRPPFVVVDDNQMAVILQHLQEPAPRLDALRPEVTPAVAELVARCLDKDPKRRPADAAEVLAEITRLSEGTTALITAHPAPPIVRANLVQTYTFEWELQASPEALWPFVSNTDKMNRATGLAPVHFEIESISSAADSRTTGNQRVAGLALKWREHPYEWIEGSRHVVLRVFDKGVLRWYVAEVHLERTASGGTRLRNTIRLEPRGLLARVLSRWEIGVRYRRRLDKVYTRIDRILAAGPRPEIDPIDPGVQLSPQTQQRLAKAAEQLAAVSTGDARASEALVAYLTHASDQDVARLRPIELASKFGLPEDAMIDTCLHAAKLGLLAMVWDVICPSCRIPSSVVDSLAKIEEHAHCKTCNLGFDVDFSRAIELAFRAAPELRDVETRTYCIGGPAHFPHVAAQVRLAPSERFALPLSLAPGFYLLRSPQLPRTHELRVTPTGGVRRIDVALGDKSDLPALTAGDQLVTLVNPTERELVVRVERAGDRAFALTAARVMACASFRELFPDQSLAPGRLMAVTQATLVIAQVDHAQELFRELGDSKAFPVASRFFEQVGSLARDYGGSLVNTFGGLAIAGFERPGPAVDAALALHAALASHPLTRDLRCRVAVHRGPMMALTQAGRLDYFGQNVELALAACRATPPGVVAITDAVCQVIEVAERLPAAQALQPFGDGWVMHVAPS